MFHIEFYSPTEQKTICEDAIYVFANVHPMKVHHLRMLSLVSSPSNPVARIQANLFANNQFKKGVKSLFHGTNIPNIARICKNAKLSSMVATSNQDGDCSMVQLEL
jgi:hypothetical protein